MIPRIIPDEASDEVWARWPNKLKGVQKEYEKGVDSSKTDAIGCVMGNVLGAKGVQEKMPIMNIQDLQNVSKVCEKIEGVKGVPEMYTSIQFG